MPSAASAAAEQLRRARGGDAEGLLGGQRRHLVDEALGLAERDRAAPLEVVDHLGDGGVELGGGHGAVDQAELGRARGREPPAPQERLERIAAPHLGQADHRDDRGDDAEADLGEAEQHVVARAIEMSKRRGEPDAAGRPRGPSIRPTTGVGEVWIAREQRRRTRRGSRLPAAWRRRAAATARSGRRRRRTLGPCW